MDPFVIIGFLVIGGIAGLAGGLLGMSGGVLAVPMLVLLFNMFNFPQEHLMHTAIGTSLAAMVMTGLASTWAHNKHQGVMWSIVLVMVPGVFMGCLLGAFVAHFLPGAVLEVIFGLFVACLGAWVLFHKKKQGQEVTRPDKSLYTWFGLGIGSISSLLGIGGGTFLVPLFLSHHYPTKRAIGTSAATGLSITIMGALAYIYFGLKVSTYPLSLGYVYLPGFGLAGAMTLLSAPLGARLAQHLPSVKLRKIFASSLILVGILMVFH